MCLTEALFESNFPPYIRLHYHTANIHDACMIKRKPSSSVQDSAEVI